MPRREYERLTTLSIEQGLALIRLGRAGVQETRIQGKKVGIFSLRLQTFLEKGIQCSHDGCPLCGSFFAVERTPPSKLNPRYYHPHYGRYHINLWGIDANGNEVLFTHDHIFARALGGSDTLSNSVTMCKKHNQVKSQLESRVAELLQKADELTLESGLIYQDPVERLGKRARRRRNRQAKMEQMVYGEPVLAAV